jgi:hypothetical protein
MVCGSFFASHGSIIEKNMRESKGKEKYNYTIKSENVLTRERERNYIDFVLFL